MRARLSHLHGRLGPARGLWRSVENERHHWNARGLIPSGYRLTVCPPTVFNVVGMLVHQEWSDTRTLELSAYRDERGNAVGVAVGSNRPGDFSYARHIEADAELGLLGFRVALIPA